MTEIEELAEEFADRARIVDENTKAGDDCISLVQDYEGNVMDIHQRIKTAYLAGYNAGYNKANEWHFVSEEGEYPKEKQLVMVYRVNPLGANIAVTEWYNGFKNTKVIAWKEIVLPELPKEN